MNEEIEILVVGMATLPNGDEGNAEGNGVDVEWYDVIVYVRRDGNITDPFEEVNRLTYEEAIAWAEAAEERYGVEYEII